MIEGAAKGISESLVTRYLQCSLRLLCAPTYLCTLPAPPCLLPPFSSPSTKLLSLLSFLIRLSTSPRVPGLCILSPLSAVAPQPPASHLLDPFSSIPCPVSSLKFHVLLFTYSIRTYSSFSSFSSSSSSRHLPCIFLSL